MAHDLSRRDLWTLVLGVLAVLAVGALLYAYVRSMMIRSGGPPTPTGTTAAVFLAATDLCRAKVEE